MSNSVFSRLFHSRAAPENSLSTSHPFFFGRASSGANVNERTALRTAAVYACVRVISEAIASLPLHLYQYDANGFRPATEHPLDDILHTVPNSEMTSFIFRETLMSHLLLWGNAYAQILRDGSGRVTMLYPLLPNKMDVSRSESGEIFYTYWRDYDETRPQEKSGGVILKKSEVLHIPGLSFDGLVGYSPIALAKNAIGMVIATEDYGASFFANGANPGGVLEHPGTLKNADSIRSTWEALYKGTGKSHRIAVLEEGLKFHTIGIPPEQAQFLETRKFQLNEIARIFRVPPHMIGDLEKSTFSNIEQQSMEFVKYTLDPWVVRLEQAMNQTLLTQAERKSLLIRFNLDGLLRGDYATRMNGYAIGRQNGWLSANDIRRLEDLNPIPTERGGDKYLVNGNMVDLEDAGAAYKQNGGA
jgi:HK97 family phage portal protein